MNHIDSDPGLHLTPKHRLLLVAIIIIGLAIAVALALTDTAGATTLEGNGGGCAPGNRWRGLACTVSDAGVGWVSGDCDYGLWFDHARSARTFRSGQPITLQACEGPDGELFSARGWPLRISR